MFLCFSALQEIVPGVYLGPYASAGKKMAASLKSVGITHIVCVRFSDIDTVYMLDICEIGS